MIPFFGESISRKGTNKKRPGGRSVGVLMPGGGGGGGGGGRRSACITAIAACFMQRGGDFVSFGFALCGGGRTH